MVLNATHRGLIEQLIDGSIQDMPDTVKFVRHHHYSKILKDKNGDDFVLGFVVGRINTTFTTSFITAQDRNLTDDEMIDLDSIIYNRIDQIKEAIFQCG